MRIFLPALAAAALGASPLLAAEARDLNVVEDSYPAISPDGRTMVFQSNRMGRVALFFADADGSNLRPFIDPGNDPASANWSPDGRSITYSALLDGDPEIFIVDVATKAIRRLTSIKGDDSHPIFSSDGERIFFSSNRHTPDISIPWGRQWHDTFSMRLDGSDMSQHSDCRTVCTYPAPSPDGKRLAYRKLTAEPGLQWDLSAMPLNSEIYVADVDGSNERLLAGGPAFDGWPAWSPDGHWIAFASNRAGPRGTGHVWLVNPDGGEPTPLTMDDASHVQPRWSHDSRKIYVSISRDEAANIGVVDLPDGN